MWRKPRANKQMNTQTDGQTNNAFGLQACPYANHKQNDDDDHDDDGDGDGDDDKLLAAHLPLLKLAHSTTLSHANRHKDESCRRAFVMFTVSLCGCGIVSLVSVCVVFVYCCTRGHQLIRPRPPPVNSMHQHHRQPRAVVDFRSDPRSSCFARTKFSTSSWQARSDKGCFD